MSLSLDPTASSTLEVHAISEDAFRAYGHVSNLGRGDVKGDHSGGLANERSRAKEYLYTVEADAITLPFVVKLLEKHSFSSQTFVPISQRDYLVVVALPRHDGTPDMATLRAFRAPGDTVITYAPGIWHHPMGSLSSPGVFAVLMWRDLSENDETFLTLPRAVTLVDGTQAPVRETLRQ